MARHQVDKRGPRIAELERKVSLLEKDKRTLEGTNEELRKAIAWVRSLSPEHQSIIRNLLFQLDTTATLSDANQALTYRPKISGGGGSPAHDPKPVWAHNFLEGVMDHLAEVARAVATFNYTTPEVRSTRRSCPHCRNPIDMLLAKSYCTWCGRRLKTGNDETEVA